MLMYEINTICLQADLICRHGGPKLILVSAREEHPVVTKCGYLYLGIVGDDQLVDVYLYDALAGKGLQTNPQDKEIATRFD